MFKLYIYVYFWLVIFAVVLKLKENCKIVLISKILAFEKQTSGHFFVRQVNLEWLEYIYSLDQYDF